MTHPMPGAAPELLLLLMAGAMAASFSVWQALLNNFVVEQASFTGAEIGLLQSLREVPGFLAFTVVFVLLLVRGADAGYRRACPDRNRRSPNGPVSSRLGLYTTTVIMSVGFHYYETLQQSLTLQWLDKAGAIAMGLQMSARSIASIGAFIFVWLGIEVLRLDYAWLYLFAGYSPSARPWLPADVPRFPRKQLNQNHHPAQTLLALYALTFMGGAETADFSWYSRPS